MLKVYLSTTQYTHRRLITKGSGIYYRIPNSENNLIYCARPTSSLGHYEEMI